jgi:hypothetical protein
METGPLLTKLPVKEKRESGKKLLDKTAKSSLFLNEMISRNRK